MDVEGIRSALASTRFADLRVVAETGSTNADVATLARDGGHEGIVVVADHQTAGRGRLDRSWHAPPGSSLLLSVLTRPTTGGAIPGGPDPTTSGVELAVEELHLVSMAVGVAAAEAARAITGADIRVKWPNDLVYELDDDDTAALGMPLSQLDPPSGDPAGAPRATSRAPSRFTRKLSGILAESLVEGGRVDALVVGIGINVNWPEDLPEELKGIAVSLNHLVGHDVDRTELLLGLLHGFDTYYGALAHAEGRAGLLLRYRELSATLGHRVRVTLDGELIEGDAVDLTADGHLLVVDDCPDRPREIVAGDVIHVRRQD